MDCIEVFELIINWKCEEIVSNVVIMCKGSLQ